VATTLPRILSDERRLLAAVVDSADEAILTQDLNGTILSWNAAAERIYGYRPADVIGRQASILEPPDRAGETAGILRNVRRGERIERVQTVHKTKDGRPVDILLTVAPILGDGGEVVGASSIAHDITERIRLGEELRAAQRLEAVGRLAGGVAHEFNDILVTIGGYAQLLAEDLPENDPRRASAEAIRRASDRAARLTEKLLAVGRQQPLTLRVLDVDRIVEAAETHLATLCGDAIRLEVVAGSPGGRVRADARHLEQALDSMVAAMSRRVADGGTIRISTSDAPDASTGDPPGPAVRIVVADTGPKIEEDAVRHLFEPFAGVGIDDGLGLATVHGLIAQFGGRTTAESGPDGLSLVIDLPVEAEVAPPAPIDARERPRGGGEAILLVDDDADARELMRRVLERFGYSVQTASSGEEALALADDYFAEPVDLLVADVDLPGIPGPELAEQLRAERQHLAVLYVAGYTANTDAYDDHDGSASSLLVKPFTPDRLAEAVRTLLDARAARRD
jgi:two-component system cell cycle sensor histidine kinase/response regulator CckA